LTAPLVSQFVKVLNGIDQSKSRTEVFADFCELSYCALAKVACPSEEQRDALEQQYMGVVARYRNKDDVRKMPELLAFALEAIHVGGMDFLGAVAGELGVLDARLGQFFTPYHVSRMMAEISLTDVANTIEANGFVTVSEPAVGAGGMVIAVADVIEGLGFDPACHLWVEATELSHTTYYMGFIQINARGVAGKITCGNSLSMETFTSAYTAAAPGFISHNGHPFAKQHVEEKQKAARLAAQEQQQTLDRAARIADLGLSQPKIPTEQLGLFD
jgi:hypothetical protein